MTKFLQRKVYGIPVWAWTLGCIVLAVLVEKTWALFFGGSAAALALRQAAIEAGERADRLLDAANEQPSVEATQDAAALEAGDTARSDTVEEVANWQDNDSEFME